MRIQKIEESVDWTEFNLGAPREVGPNFLLTVKTDHKGFEDDQELQNILEDAKKTATKHLLDFFYRKEVSEQKLEFFIEKSVEADKWYLEPRRFSRLKVLVSIDQGDFMSEFELKDVKRPSEVLKGQGETIESSLMEVNSVVDRINERILEFEDQIISFKGLVEGFPSEKYPSGRLRRELKKFPQGLRDFLGWNKVPEFSDLTFVIDVDFSLINVIGTNFDRKKNMVIGFDVFIKENASSPRVMSLIVNAIKNTDKFFDEDLTWEEWLGEFLFPPVVIKPSIETAKKKVKQTAEDLFKNTVPDPLQSPISTVADKVDFDRRIDGDFKINMRRRREGEVDFVGDAAISDPEFIAPRMVTLDDIYFELLHAFDFGALVETVLSCFPNLDVQITLPDIPTFSFPQLPVIDILFFLRINLEDLILAIIRAILQLLMQMLLDAIRKFCEQGINVGGSKPTYGAADIGDELGTVTADVPGTMEDLQGQPGDLLLDFVKDLSQALTPSQICELLSGEPTDVVFEIIEEVLSEPKYEILRDSFDTEEEIIDFFSSLGAIIGMVRVKEICDIEGDIVPDFCEQEQSVKNIQSRLFEIKRNAGENIPREYEEEILARGQEIQEAIVGTIRDLVENKNAFDSIKDDILDELNSFRPADSMPPDVKLATDSVVDGIMDPIFKRFDSDIKQYLNFLQEREVQNAAENLGASLKLELATQLTPGALAQSAEVPDDIDLASLNELAGLVQTSPFFNEPGFVNQMLSNISDMKFSEAYSLEEVKDKIKEKTLNASISDFSDSVDGEKSLFEDALFQELMDLLIVNRVIDFNLRLLPLYAVFRVDLNYLAKSKIRDLIIADIKRIVDMEGKFENTQGKSLENFVIDRIKKIGTDDFLEEIMNKFNINIFSLNDYLVSKNKTTEFGKYFNSFIILSEIINNRTISIIGSEIVDFFDTSKLTIGTSINGTLGAL